MRESAFLNSSLWDSAAYQEVCNEITAALESADYVSALERSNSKLSSCFTTPNELSSSSDLENFMFEDLENILPVTDSFISQILEECSSTEFSEPDLSSTFDVSTECNISTNNNSTSVCECPKKTKKSVRYLSAKSWSKMSPEEQLETLHALSDIVTCSMGIREQIEIIKIIDPSVSISPDDTEFALDSSSLNDAKMKRIRDYLQKRGFCSSSKKVSGSSSSQFSSVKSGSSKVFRKSTSRTKRRQKKQKTCSDEDIRQKRKLELHGKKEAQSGLFVYEKVIKLSSPLEDDEDVNILE